MRTKSYLCLIAFFTLNLVHSQSVLRVESGKNLNITEDKFVDKLIMEDNSSITLEPGLKTWKLTALDASFGKNCSIFGNGIHLSSKKGKKGIQPSPADECHNGIEGGKGEDGSQGGDGCNIEITMGIRKINELLIENRGGNGGYGGPGGTGGSAGNVKCNSCDKKTGGNGGPGGYGGPGGNGGNVTIRFWVLDGTETNNEWTDDNLPGLTVRPTQGHGEVGGEGGKPGIGSQERDCNGYKIGPGDAGNHGTDRSSKVGQEGTPGIKDIKPIPSPQK